jgi:hypothetical protein
MTNHCAPTIEETPAPRVFAAMLSFGVTGGHWFQPGDGRGWHGFLAAVVVASIAFLQLVWLYRARSTRRWKAALDVYAEREIARDQRRKGSPLTGGSPRPR